MAERKGTQAGLGLWGVGGRVAVSDPPTPLSPQTGQVLEKGPVLRLHNLQRDAGGGYRCVASVPSVPGLNRTQLVRVAIFGEALWAETGRPGKLPPAGWFRALRGRKATGCPGMLWRGRGGRPAELAAATPVPLPL